MKMNTQIFQDIYTGGKWGYSIIPGIHGGSGPGGDPIIAEPYMKFLQNFLKDKDIKSVVDLGSGDWHFSRYIDWSGIQ